MSEDFEEETETRLALKLPKPIEGQTHWHVFHPNNPDRGVMIPVELLPESKVKRLKYWLWNFFYHQQWCVKCEARGQARHAIAKCESPAPTEREAMSEDGNMNEPLCETCGRPVDLNFCDKDIDGKGYFHRTCPRKRTVAPTFAEQPYPVPMDGFYTEGEK